MAIVACAIVIVAKAPAAGCVKTRLCPPLTEEQAAQLAVSFLDDTVALATEAACGDLYVGYASPEETASSTAAAATFLRDRFPGVKRLPQGGGDLGSRLVRLHDVLRRRGFGRVIFIGSDTPHLSPQVLRDAASALSFADLVLGPAEDGGYYLIGLSDAAPGLFEDMAWSTDRVFEETMRRAETTGLKVRCLNVERDIDKPEDLQWLAAPGRLADASATACALAALK